MTVTNRLNPFLRIYEVAQNGKEMEIKNKLGRLHELIRGKKKQ